MITQEQANAAADRIVGLAAIMSAHRGSIAAIILDAANAPPARDLHVDAVIMAQVVITKPGILGGAIAFLQSDDCKRVDLIVPYSHAVAVEVAAAIESVHGLTAKVREFPLGAILEVSGPVDDLCYRRLPKDER